MIRVFSDSTSDLSPGLREQYGITILPLNVILGEDEYTDGESISPDEIYRWSDANKSTPKTSAISLGRTIDAYKACLDGGDDIVSFAISAEMSTTCNVMRLAAQELEAEDRITIINSANLSTGIGLLVIEAARMAQKGCSAAEITAHIEALKPLVRASFVVDTLTYLHRGGRCSGAAALVGSTLKLHPCISVRDGKMSPGKKYRGKMSSAILAYARDLEADLLKAQCDRVFITHSGCEQAVIDSVRDYLSSLGRFDEILITRAGSVISSHCGPGTLGVLFIAGE